MERIEVLESNIRIDIYLSQRLEYSRSKIAKMIKDGLILVNGKKVKNSYILNVNDKLEIE